MCKKIIAFLVLVLVSKTACASECYHYHTSVQYHINTTATGVYVIANTIDPNGFSISESEKVKIANANESDWKIEAKSDGFLLLSTNESYYILGTSDYNLEKEKPIKLFNKNEVSDTFNGNVFNKNNEWIYVTYNNFDKKITQQKLTNLPVNAQLFAQTISYAYLLKNKQAVYTYSVRHSETEIIKIDNINGENTHFIAPNYYLDNYFLYDNDTFYLLDSNLEVIEDITNQFKELNFTEDFTTLEYVNNGFLSGFYNAKENVFWSYVEAGISLENGSNTYFYPIENALVTPNKMFVVINGKYYNDSWSAIYQTNEIQHQGSIFLDKLELFPNEIYYDGTTYFSFNYDSKTFEPVNYLNGTIQFFNGISSYQHATPMFFAMKNNLYFFKHNSGINKIEAINTEIKNLYVAYAFNDKLLIGDNVIKSPTDINTVTFANSLVDVQSGCDGGHGQIPVIVHYYHFFKDKNGLYVYSTETETIKKVDDINVATNFETMNMWFQKQKENN